MKKVMVSAGHSFKDPGAVNAELRITEANEAVRLRDMVANELGALGIVAIEDGLDGQNQPLPQAIALAEKCDIAIELHFNAATPAATGIESISLASGKKFAQDISAAIGGVTGGKLRGIDGWIDESKSQHPRLGFVHAGAGLKAIVEVAFISNKQDMASYLPKSKLVAKAIANVVAAYAKPLPNSGVK